MRAWKPCGSAPAAPRGPRRTPLRSLSASPAGTCTRTTPRARQDCGRSSDLWSAGTCTTRTPTRSTPCRSSRPAVTRSRNGYAGNAPPARQHGAPVRPLGPPRGSCCACARGNPRSRRNDQYAGRPGAEQGDHEGVALVFLRCGRSHVLRLFGPGVLGRCPARHLRPPDDRRDASRFGAPVPYLPISDTPRGPGFLRVRACGAEHGVVPHVVRCAPLGHAGVVAWVELLLRPDDGDEI